MVTSATKPFIFAYEKKIQDRFLLNGLSENTEYFERWLNRRQEYAYQDCGNPLKSILQATHTPILDRTINDCLQSGEKFIYPIEILRSNNAWLLPRLYNEHSPWPSISENTKSALQKGQGLLLLTHLKMQSDSVRGDPIRSQVFEKLHQALEHFKIPAESVLYVGNSPELNGLYKKFLNSRGAGPQLKDISHVNYLEKGWQLYFEGYRKNNEVFDLELSKSAYHRLRPSKFLCFNREPRAHRKLNLSWLQKTKLIDQGLVSFFPQEHLLTFDKENPLPPDLEFENLMTEYSKIEMLLPKVVDAPEGFHVSFCKRWAFADTYFSFLTERVFDCQSNWTLHTPKVFKSICNMHPFIVLGQHGYLAALRKFGYKTFSPFIDESYDDISDPVLRTKAVWAEVEKLCSKNTNELHEWYYSMMPVLEHNWITFLKRSQKSEYNKFIENLNGQHVG